MPKATSPETDTSLRKTKTDTENPPDVIQAQKGLNERLFILTRTHSMQMFGEVPFIKPQNDI